MRDGVYAPRSVRGNEAPRGPVARGLALIAVMLAACRDPRAPPERPARPARPSAALRLAQGSDDASAATEGAPTDDRELAACVARVRAGTPEALSAALEALAPSSLAVDACRLDLAAEAASASRCAAIELEPLRETCVARVAMLLGAPEQCPSARGALGRDPLCVAVAARAPSLCAGANVDDRRRCLALLHRDPGACAPLPEGARARCLDDLRRFGARVPRVEGPMHRDGAASYTLSDSADASSDERPVRGFARGVLLDPSGGLWLVDPVDGWPRTYGLGDGALHFGAWIPSPNGARRQAVSVRARANLPDGTLADTDDGSARATVQFERTPQRRGDRVLAVVTMVLPRGAGSVQLRVVFDTFVRDVAPVTVASLRADAGT